MPQQVSKPAKHHQIMATAAMNPNASMEPKKVGAVTKVGRLTSGIMVRNQMTATPQKKNMKPFCKRMGAALPYAGGTYQYAGLGLGRPLGMLAGWNFIISLVAVTGGESLAFAYYFKTVFLAIGIELPVPDVVLACIALVLFIVVPGPRTGRCRRHRGGPRPFPRTVAPGRWRRASPPGWR